ncbi:hypothetical protein SAMN05892883_1688 [Jatrophihabitans sp. GAS493]|uniref:hypothetical protein n=1 Tax=Jatrophihabitans sp. GAS493 TaxID=1907575 RepID=UPI000BB7D239|nr:hypothetical protein [Jatrophihabitans sp. GAS493]SOD72281.1 hypothetical protein SAMN05892883_1688 [Jatrophihabitans sp. GAS493]
MRRLPSRLLPLAPLLAVVACGTAAATTPHPPAAPTPVPNLSAFNCSGASLGGTPVLSPGETITVAVHGFAPQVAVAVRLVGRPQSQPTPIADKQGIVQVVYRVPANTAAGSHLLTLSGLPPIASPHGAAAPGSGAIAISVVVPNTGFFRFSVNRSRPAPACAKKPTVSS